MLNIIGGTGYISTELKASGLVEDVPITYWARRKSQGTVQYRTFDDIPSNSTVIDFSDRANADGNYIPAYEEGRIALAKRSAVYIYSSTILIALNAQEGYEYNNYVRYKQRVEYGLVNSVSGRLIIMHLPVVIGRSPKAGTALSCILETRGVDSTGLKDPDKYLAGCSVRNLALFIKCIHRGKLSLGTSGNFSAVRFDDGYLYHLGDLQEYLKDEGQQGKFKGRVKKLESSNCYMFREDNRRLSDIVASLTTP